MYAERPLSLSMLLPQGVSADDFYVGVTTALALLCVWAITQTFSPRRQVTSRIRAIQERRQELRGELTGPRKRKQTGSEGSVNFMRAVAMKLQLVKNLQVGKAQSMMVEAGFHSKDAIFVMSFFVMVLPIVLGVIGIIVMKMNSGVSVKWQVLNYIWPVLGAYMGLKLPWIYIRRCRKKRYYKIQRSLADVLDLMTICAEAGLSLAAMIERVGRELMISYPEMAEELSLTSIEIGFLPDRNKALTNLAERCQLPEVRGIVSVLIQTEKYGTPIAQALRVLSTEFRQQRMLRAEQKAAKLPALMTIPMIVFILPTLFIVIIAPAGIKLATTIANN